MKLGIGMVFQNFRLVQTLTAAENIVLGEKSSFWRGPKWMKEFEQARNRSNRRSFCLSITG